MEFALVLRELWGRKRLLAVGVLVAIIAATMSVSRLDGLKLKSRSLVYSAGTTQVLVDTASSILGNNSQVFDGPDARATVFANFMTSPAVLALIGQKAGIPGDEIYAEGPVNPNVPRVVQEPTAGQRNVEITGETNPYRLTLTADPDLPVINISSQAPTTKQAIALANGAVAGLTEYVNNVETDDHIRSSNRVVMRQLGAATGGVVDPGIRKSLAAMVFVLVFVLWCVLLLVGARFRANWRASGVIGSTRPRNGNGPAPTRNGSHYPREPVAAGGGHGRRAGVSQRLRRASRDAEDENADTLPDEADVLPHGFVSR